MASTFNRTVNSSFSIKKKSSLLLEQCPSDSISELTWSNENNPNYLAVTSWDKTARIWEITQTNINAPLQAYPRIMFTHTAPLLTSCFSTDNTKYFAGGCDNLVKMYDIATGDTQGTQVAQHDKPVSKVMFFHQRNLLITTSWDGFVKMWDLRSPTPAWSRNIQSKIFRMDLKYPYMILSDNKQMLHTYNFSQTLDGPTLTMTSVLTTQTRSVSLFPANSRLPGVIIGSLEGRCGVMYFDEHNLTKKTNGFCFKCNRTDPEKGLSNVYSVNAIDFFPNSLDVFVTAGSDGFMSVWHKSNKSKLKGFEQMATSISDCKCNKRYNFLAYAESYDWHKGDDPSELQKKLNNVYVHTFKDEELIPKK